MRPDPTAEVLVRSQLTRNLILTLLAAALLSFACGGGGDDDVAPTDLDTIPTATPPETLPDPLIVAQGEVPVSGTTYTVQEGDTLIGIAEQFGTTVEALVEANDLGDTTGLEVGQELTIPGVVDDNSVLGEAEEPTDEPDETDPAEPTAEPAPIDTPVPVEEVPSDTCAGHVVAEGEFPDNIAPQYGLTVEELMAANPSIDPTALQIGDCLTIP